MRIKVNFHKTLHKYTKGYSEFTFEVNNFNELSYAIKNTFEELVTKFMDFSNFTTNKDILIMLDNNKSLITEKTILRNPTDIPEVYVVPSISGGGGGKSSIILGAAIAAFAFFAIPALAGAAGALGSGTLAAGTTTTLGSAASAFSGLTGFAGFAAQSLLGVGINLILGGLAALFSKKPKPKDTELDRPERTENNAFGSLTNSTNSDNSVQMLYGMHRIGGQLVSGYVKTRDHGKNDIIEVGEEFE